MYHALRITEVTIDIIYGMLALVWGWVLLTIFLSQRKGIRDATALALEHLKHLQAMQIKFLKDSHNSALGKEPWQE